MEKRVEIGKRVEMETQGRNMSKKVDHPPRSSDRWSKVLDDYQRFQTVVPIRKEKENPPRLRKTSVDGS